MSGIVMTAQFILGLSLLVGLHELGHFLPAKWFGMKVEKFYLFFDAFGVKLFSRKKGDTEYGIGWLPFGGYVKIAGMVDESLDTESLKKPAESWEFRSKPAWQRLIVMLGGVTVNFVTGIFIFIAMTYHWGESYLPAKEAKYGIVAHKLAKEIGFQTGDKIVAINGKSFENFNDIYSPDVLLGNNAFITVERNGEITDIKIPLDFADKLADKANQGAFIEAAMPFQVNRVIEGSPASKAGLHAGDVITGIDTLRIQFFHELKAALQLYKGKEVALSIIRNNEPMQLQATVGQDALLGFEMKSLLKTEQKKYGFIESVGVGTQRAFSVVSMQWLGFQKMFSGEINPSKSLSGPIGIAQNFGGTWDWVRFWSLTALLSMVLAFMNLLPIPALDGGHVLFLLFEIITRRKPSDKFLEITQRVGMSILLVLMGYAIFNDISRFF